MVPAAGLLIFLKQYIVRSLAGPSTVPWDEIADSDLDEDEDDDKDKVKLIYYSLTISIIAPRLND